jgi:very-short-patch-repair endonuclease
VIAMGITHAQRIQAALDRALESHSELDKFFDQNTLERFFVKNLERVQGDERDAIILSIGYSKDRTGRLLYHFGPLLSAGGERRLNVAITRARNRMTLVSSFDHTDMDPGRSTARGVELLRLYLQYAASRGENLGDTGQSNVPIDAFEADVLDALTSRGIKLIPQWGASKYRIDFVAQHSERPGRFVLALECDGASYHSAPTARDRDRLRQQHLEALGWRFHRIWSTDWFMHREAEIERALSAYRAAIRQADEDDAQGARVFESHPAEPSPVVPASVTAQRSPKPMIPPGKQIDDYVPTDLIALVRWVESDGRLRTDAEILNEIISALGFRRRGTRIEAAIRAAIAETRRGPK